MYCNQYLVKAVYYQCIVCSTCGLSPAEAVVGPGAGLGAAGGVIPVTVVVDGEAGLGSSLVPPWW